MNSAQEHGAERGSRFSITSFELSGRELVAKLERTTIPRRRFVALVLYSPS